MNIEIDKIINYDKMKERIIDNLIETMRNTIIYEKSIFDNRNEFVILFKYTMSEKLNKHLSLEIIDNRIKLILDENLIEDTITKMLINSDFRNELIEYTKIELQHEIEGINEIIDEKIRKINQMFYELNDILG